MDDASDPDIWVTWVTLAGFSLVQAAGGSGFGVDLVTAMSLSSSLGSSGFIPMLSAIHGPAPAPTVRAATIPWLFPMNCVGSPFNKPVFSGDPSSACKLSSIPLSTGSPKQSASRTH